MVQLDLDNVYLKITGLEKDIEIKLWNELSFGIQIFGVPEIRYRHLYNRKTKKTYAGLLDYVKDFFKEKEIDYILNDNRVKPEQNANFKLVDYIDSDKKIPLKLRPYQQDIVDKCREREVIQACTGAGKTLMMAACIAKFNVKPVCIFADKIGLCMQLKQEMEKFLGVEVGLVGDGVEDYKDITVISTQSADDNYIKDAKMCLWDECLPYDTEILLENRTCMKIGDIVKQKQMVNVWTYNIYTHQFEVKPIIDFGVTDIGTKKILKLDIKRNDGKNIVLHCTDNHKVFIKNKNDYVRADYLNVGDKVVVGTVETLILKQYEGAIDNIEVDNSNAENYVYDLTVADNHNFIANGVLVSNCHHIPAQTITTIANKCKNAYYRIGVSATPWRDAGDDLLIEAVLNKKKDAVINASMLIEMGYLVKPEIYFVPIKQVFKGKNYQDIYNKAIVENLDRNKIITKIAYNMYIRDKHILMLYKNIKHGEKLLDMVSKRIGEKVKPFTIKNQKTNKDVTVRVRNVELLSGNDDTVKRLAVFEAVKTGFCRCLIASTIADEGLDLPILDTLILAGGGKSSTRAFQRIGRVIRLHEGKTKGIVFDFTDYTPMLRRHSRNRQKYYEQEPLWDIHKFNVNPD